MVGYIESYFNNLVAMLKINDYFLIIGNHKGNIEIFSTDWNNCVFEIRNSIQTLKI
jgi:hypothetical protein